MKQILQHLKTGEMELAEVPCPAVSRGMILIRTTRSVISAGTEKMLIEFGKGNLLQKARSQPEKVKQVIDKIRTDGLMPTVEAVFRKLDEPIPLGYCNAGIVLEVGEGVQDIRPGDRVISNGPHAEIVSVPRNLVAKIPDGVSDDSAAFTVLGAIALQGLRLAQPTFGERFMVFGMGLLGLITVQLLRAHGCSVIAVDMNASRLELAALSGAQCVDLGAGGDPIQTALAATGGIGVDGVLITASSKSDEIVHQAAEACRKRGRIVLVGVVGLNLQRNDFYKKELSFQVSCSYGPGRYDERYEQRGQDYPLPFVRWTEGRNFEAVLQALATGALDVEPMITHRFPVADAVQAYDRIQGDPDALGVVLTYPETVSMEQRIHINPVSSGKPAPEGKVVIGVIGGGNFSVGVILPALVQTDARIKYLAGRTNSASLAHAARKFNIEQAVTDYTSMLNDDDVNTVFIVTGHNTHARFVCEALQHGKHVFVEKPLCLNESELMEIESAYAATDGDDLHLMVGFNRRFSPHVVKMKELLSSRNEPLSMSMMVNAGAIPPDHWTQDPLIGGGRIIGEGCHFVDLLMYLAGAPISHVSSVMVGEGPAIQEDKMSIILKFTDGSIGTVNYFANGSKSYPKETLEVFSDGRVLKLDNFRETSGYGFKGFRKFKTRSQDKGHASEIASFIERVSVGGEPLIPFGQLVNVTKASFAAVDSAKNGGSVLLP